MANQLKVVASVQSEAVQTQLFNQLKGLDYIDFDNIYPELADAVSATQTIHPDVVIIDMTDREMDAGLTIQTLSMDVDNPFVIFALHAKLDHQVIIQAVQSGAKEFIHYPEEPEALELALKRHLTILRRSMTHGSPGDSSPQTEGQIISVFAAKGGCGASTVAANLAHELQVSTNSPVCLLDMDQWYNNTAVLLGLTPDYSLGDLAENNIESIDFELLQRIIVQHQSGIQVVVGSKNILDDNDMVPPELLEKVLDYLKSQYTYVVVDLPTYVLDFYHNFMVEHSDTVLLVSSLDVPGMFRTCQYLELAKKYYPDISKLKLVMNRWNLKAAYGMSNKSLEEQFQYPVYCRLANDWELNVEANSRGFVLSQVKPKSELVKNIQQLADLVHGEVAESSVSKGSSASTDGSSGFLGKFFGGKRGDDPNTVTARSN